MTLSSRISSGFAERFAQTLRGVRRAGMPVAAERLEAIAARASQTFWRSRPLEGTDPLVGRTFDEEMATVGGFHGWLCHRRADCRQFVEHALDALNALHISAPDSARVGMEIAAHVRRHEFNFLGSGRFRSVAPDRAVRPDGYEPIDWYLDPVRGLRFPEGIPYKQWNLFEMRPGNADIKYPWELGRCQHLLALGQAYLLARSDGAQASIDTADAFAFEILSQCEDFIDANPVGIGVHWTCTMDVALRAANWCMALALVKNCEALPAIRLEAVYLHLYDTGLFIVGNFENRYEVTSNHFLSNIVGLHILAGEFADLELGRAWDAYARRALEQEILVQVLEDGADYESSIPYHRLVTELFLGAWRLAQVQRRPLSDKYRDRLVSMIDFLTGTLRPDGRMPIVGDADDGRLMIATGYGGWDPSDARHILAPAALALDEPHWFAYLPNAGAAEDWQDAVWEAFWWGFTPDMCSSARAKASSVPPAVARFFPDAGVAVSRGEGAEGSYLLVTNGIVGTKGFGNHKHNDLLSFEYFDRGAAVIVDPGSYVYTSDFDARYSFRSTASHNTVLIDGVEQNEIDPAIPFRMFEKGRPDHASFATPDATTMIYEGSHDGYLTQVEPGVRQSRRFVHERATGRLAIQDWLEGAGEHEAVWHFHLAPGVEPTLSTDGGALRLAANGLIWELEWDDSALAVELFDSWVSPSYGVRRAGRSVKLARRILLSAPLSVDFELRRLET